MAQDLFYAVLGHLEELHPGFGRDRRPRFAFRFKRVIHLVDATTIQLVARCLDWAKHRRRKAAAKCHLRLDLQTFLPRFALVDTAGEHESLRAREVCAGVRAGEIVIFDKAYVDFTHLADLALREVFWVMVGMGIADDSQQWFVNGLYGSPRNNASLTHIHGWGWT